MLIKSLEQMEAIVESRKDLLWDGWTVVHSVPNRNGVTSPRGRRVNGVWHIQKRYQLTTVGWHIPEKLLGKQWTSTNGKTKPNA